MLHKDDALDLIREAYAARVDGNKEAMGRYWAEGAHFEIVGDQSLVDKVQLSSAHPMEAVSGLIDQFEFSDLELLDSVVEGNKVAARWRVTVTPAGKPPVTTQLFDLIELDDDRKIRSLVQFTDTALMRHVTG